MSNHKMLDGKCDKCGCRAWEQSKPCSQPSKALRKPRARRGPRERSYMDYAPGSGNYNDCMFGEGGN